MFDPLSIYFVNGNWCEQKHPSIFANDRGFLLADGIFETLLAIDGRCIALAEHWQRLSQSALTLNLPISYTLENIQEIINKLLKKNQFMQAYVAIRITLTRGVTTRGLALPDDVQPTWLISAMPYHLQSKLSYRLIESQWIVNEHSPLERMKTLNYLENILAKREATLQNADDALRVNTQGNICKTSVANVFLLKDNVLLTPALSEGVLPGITRSQVLSLAEQLGFAWQEQALSIQTLKQAQAMFITNSLQGIVPIHAVGAKTFCDEHGKAHVDRFRQYFQKQVWQL